MKQKLQLPNVTICAVAGNRQAETVAALYKSMAKVEFAKIILITNTDIICSDIEVINVGGLNSWEDYNFFVVKELYKYFNTDYVLLVQWDGYILDAEQWDYDFFEYDYTAAAWLDRGKPYNVGNGGFSLRSKRLQHILAKDLNIITTCPEDVSICKVYGQYLIDNYKIKFAPEEIADKFSFELNLPLRPTFGFHGFHHQPFKETIIIKRTNALGDVVMTEPVMYYFHKKGFNVVLDTLDAYYLLFKEHYFPVYSMNQIPSNLPCKVYDLNMAYEVFPKQNHLKSYYDFCGITDGEMRNPKLKFDSAKQAKLFKKYCIIHIDNRDQAHRNIYGIDWEQVVKHLNKLGYDVIQLGRDDHEKIKGAIEMNTNAEGILMYVVGGADLYIGVDSGISHLASGFNVPSIIFFGSVNPAIIHPDLSNKICIHNHDKNVCQMAFCWHEKIGCVGVDCYIDNMNPPCTKFETKQCIEAVNKITKQPEYIIMFDKNGQLTKEAREFAKNIRHD